MAQLLTPHLPVEGKPRVGFEGHESNFEALRRGEIDLYAEYTGTALRRFLQMSPRPRHEVYPAVRDASRQRWDISWLPPFGFDNTYGLLMPAHQAANLSVSSISDLAPIAGELVLGGTPQFLQDDPPLTFAPGGYPGLIQVYGFQFKQTLPVSPEYGRSFEPLEQGKVDILVDFVVNSRIEALNLIILEDDRNFFAAYYAAPVVRSDFLLRNPQVQPLLNQLAGKIDNRTMARFNYLMEFEGLDPAEVAHNFLASLQTGPSAI